MHEVFEASPEPAGTSSALLSRDELPYRLRQQSLLCEFGSIAMQTRDFRKILQRATELCSIGLQAPFVKVLEYQPDENCLKVRAGVGWAPGTINTQVQVEGSNKTSGSATIFLHKLTIYRW